jgi:hypothetical protein
MKTKNNENTITETDLSSVTGLGGRRLRQLGAAGIIPRSKRGVYPLRETLTAFISHLRDLLDAEGDGGYRKERTMLTRVRRQLCEKELEVLSGRKIPLEEVQEHAVWLWRWLRITLNDRITLGCPEKILRLPTDASANERFAAISEVLDLGVCAVYRALAIQLSEMVAPRPILQRPFAEFELVEGELKDFLAGNTVPQQPEDSKQTT